MDAPTRLPQQPGSHYEDRLAAGGRQVVAGIDEVGRGPLAGPVVAAAAVLPHPIPNDWFGLLRDSKRMSPSERDNAYDELQRRARAIATGACSPAEIDDVGIAPATRLAMTRALEALKLQPDHLLIDYVQLPDAGIPQTPIVKGDATSISIAAASIVAKVSRDRLMAGQFESRYPGYGFARHKGYATPAHLEALHRLGPAPIHRRSFAPVRKALGLDPKTGSGALRLPPGAGRAGEAAALARLKRAGYEIMERNVRMREGEIDIIAKHGGELVFVEVKTRRSHAFGKPEESVTPAKKARLIAASQTYMAQKGLENSDWRIDLTAVELDPTGLPTRVEIIPSAITE